MPNVKGQTLKLLTRQNTMVHADTNEVSWRRGDPPAHPVTSRSRRSKRVKRVHREEERALIRPAWSISLGRRRGRWVPRAFLGRTAPSECKLYLLPVSTSGRVSVCTYVAAAVLLNAVMVAERALFREKMALRLSFQLLIAARTCRTICRAWLLGR